MGRKQHERVTVIGSYPSRSVALSELSTTATLAAGAKIEYEVYAPPQTVAKTELVRLRWNKLSAAVTSAYGSRTMALISNMRKIGVLYAVGSAEMDLQYTYGEYLNHSSCKPANAAAAYEAQKGVSFSDTDPLVIQFDNTSTANSVQEREYYIRYSYERVV